MSLLMQALKKAERAKQNAAAEDGLEKPSQAFDAILSLEPQEPPAAAKERDAPTHAPLHDIPGLAPMTTAEPAAQPARPPLDFADTPPAAQPARATPVPPVAEAPAAGKSRPHVPPQADTAAPRARVKPVVKRAAPSIDPGTIRLALLSGMLLLVVGGLGAWYWKESNAPGAGSGLPMVPMPPPNATGNAAAPLVVVVPANGAPDGASVGAAGPGSVPPPVLAASAPVSAVSPGAPASAVPPAYAAPVFVAPVATPAPARPSTPHIEAAPVQPQPKPYAAAPVTATAVSSRPPPDSGEAWRRAARVEERAPAQAAAIRPEAAASAYPDAGSTASAVSAPAAAYAGNGGGNGPIRVQRSDHAPQVNPALQSAYQAFNAGDSAAAQGAYDSVLRQEPNNRDALLGLAALAVRARQEPQAAQRYLRLLELDPNDADALAGLSGLRQGDPGQSEARLKDLLRRVPANGPLLFALGNLYAQQGRWSEAQQLYFRAVSAAPDNPDYAFNLAIGLDRLNQPKLALRYYQRALVLQQNTPGNVDVPALRQRLRELGAATRQGAE